MLQQWHIGEDVMIDALQHIVMLCGFGCRNIVSVVYQTVAERRNLADGALDGELACNVLDMFHKFVLVV